MRFHSSLGFLYQRNKLNKNKRIITFQRCFTASNRWIVILRRCAITSISVYLQWTHAHVVRGWTSQSHRCFALVVVGTRNRIFFLRYFIYLNELKTNEMMSKMVNLNDLTTSSRWSIPVVVIWAPFDKMSDKIELGILLSSELRNLQANIRSTAQKEIVLALGWVRTTSVHCLLDHLKFFNFN